MLREQRQPDANFEGDHVGEVGATLGVRQFRAPVRDVGPLLRAPRRAGRSGAGIEGQQGAMLVHGGQQRRRGSGELIERRHRRERSPRILIEPALELEHRASQLALQPQDPIRKLGDGRLCGQRVCSRAATCDDSGFAPPRPAAPAPARARAGCARVASAVLRRIHASATSRAIASRTSTSSASARLDCASARSRCRRRFCAGRKLLHHADPAHRHEVLRGRVRVRTGDGQVVEAQRELRVRQSARTDGERLRRVAARRQSGDLRGPEQRLLDSGIQAQCLSRRRRIGGRSRDRREQQQEQPAELNLHCDLPISAVNGARARASARATDRREISEWAVGGLRRAAGEGGDGACQAMP